MEEDIIKLSEFDQLVGNNKALGKHWHHGLKGKWWRDLSERRAREHIAKLEERAKEKDVERYLGSKIVLASTWNIRCGIATYTKYLWDNLNKIAPDSFAVDPIDQGVLRYRSRGKLTHLQHEFGIVPKYSELKIKGKLIITWHTVSKHTNTEIEKYESGYDVVAHIIHSEYMRHNINSTKDVWAIPHGSTSIPQMRKEDARRILGINIDMPIAFVFGFQSGAKNYQRLIDAAKNTDIHVIISGAQHRAGYSLDIQNDKNVTFANRFMEENEVNLYALASDILLFDYVGKNHYSVSGALHRIIGAGRPIVCSDIKHFDDVDHGNDCLKFKDQEGLEKCIKYALENRERFGLAAKNYAERTSWENVARRHVDIYRRYATF